MTMQWTKRFPEPSSISEAEERQAALKREVTDIQQQLGLNPRETTSSDWRGRAVKALNIKSRQLTLLNAWLKVHRGRQERSITTLLIELEPVARRWSTDAIGAGNATAAELALLDEVRDRITRLSRRAV